MNGATQARVSRMSRMRKVCQPVALWPGPMPAEPIFELGLPELVENHGSQSDPSSTAEARKPSSSDQCSRFRLKPSGGLSRSSRLLRSAPPKAQASAEAPTVTARHQILEIGRAS